MAPSTPADAKGLLLAAIRDPDPVLVLEHKRTYRAIRGPVPEGDYVVPIGRASIAREGRDVTVLAYGMMLHESLAAAETLAAEGIDVEVVDLRTLLPLDRDTIVASVAKTRRLCVVHEDTVTMGLGAELCALAAEAGVLDVPPVRVAMPDIPGIPVDDNLEDAVLPNRATIRDALVRLVGRERTGGANARTGTARDRAYDPGIPQASSVIEMALPGDHTRVAIEALVVAARTVPRCNATFAWTGIVEHEDVVVDLDLGPASPAAGRGTITLVDYGPLGSDLAVPFVRARPNRRAPHRCRPQRSRLHRLRRRSPRRRRRRRRPLPGRLQDGGRIGGPACRLSFRALPTRSSTASCRLGTNGRAIA